MVPSSCVPGLAVRPGACRGRYTGSSTSDRSARLREHLDAADAAVAGQIEGQALRGTPPVTLDFDGLGELGKADVTRVRDARDLHLVTLERGHQLGEERHVIGFRRVRVTVWPDTRELVGEARGERGPVVRDEAP